VAPGKNLRLRARFPSIPLVEGEYRIGVFVRSGDRNRLLWDVITLDVTAKPDAELVPYRTEIRGLVAFDYTVQSLTSDPREQSQQMAVPVG